MALWKVTKDGPRPVETTRFRDEDLLEEHLEDWIDDHPTSSESPSSSLEDR